MQAAAPTRGSLIGRAEELLHLHALLQSHRIVTISGTGGSGKTTLAAAYARERSDAGISVVSVDLAPIVDASNLLIAVATAVGASDEDPETTLVDAIAARLNPSATLLLLDNAEHLAAVPDFARDVLSSAPRSRILATSRGALGVDEPEEGVLRLGPLPITDAARLFLRRARLDASELASEDRASVDRICAYLDGLPLAVELAGAWTSLLTPRAILRRLADHALRLDGPDGGRLSLERIVESSLALLDTGARTVFPPLAVFPASFDERLLCTVLDVADGLSAIRALTRVGLVTVEADVQGEPSFRLLEPIRDVARRLWSAIESEDREPVERRYAEAVAERAAAAAHSQLAAAFANRDATAVLTGPDARAAYDWAVRAGDASLASWLAGSMSTATTQTGLVREGLRRLQTALALGPLGPERRANALNAVVSLRNLSGELGLVDLATEAASTARASGNLYTLGKTLVTLANQLPPNGRVEVLDEAGRVADAAGHPWLVLSTRMNLAYARLDLGDAEGAITALGRALDVIAEHQLDGARGEALAAMATAQVRAGRDEAAIAAFEEACSSLAGRAPAQSATYAVSGLAILLHRRGDDEGALQRLDEGAVLVGDSEAREAHANVAAMATVLLADRHPLVAARAAGLVDRDIFEATFLPDVDLAVRRISERLGRPRFDRERRRGLRAGLPRLLLEVAEVLADDGPPARRRLRSDYEALTSREVQVARLVARGQSDSEIGAALGVTPKTASVHVANVRAKLGTGSRVQTALAIRRMLDVAEADVGPPI